MLFGDCNWGKIVFWDTAVLVVFGHKMVNITPFRLEIGLPINLDLSDGKNKSQTHISKVVAKILNIWPKIGQLQLGHKEFKWA